MKPLTLTEEHKTKLLEMCKKLFPEYDSSKGECYCNEDQGAGYTFSDEHGDCDVCANAYPKFIEYPLEGIKLTEDLSFHWFEFCMTNLAFKLGKGTASVARYLEEEGTGEHIVDYLYEQFKLLK